MNNGQKLRKFKLTDREGYINASPYNGKGKFLKSPFVGATVEGYLDECGYLLAEGLWVVISPAELKFFEEVFDVNTGSDNQKGE